MYTVQVTRTTYRHQQEILSMTVFRKYLLIGLTNLSLSTVACGALTDSAGGDGSAVAVRIEQRLAALHDQLELTPAQATAWQPLVLIIIKNSYRVRSVVI